MDILFLSHCLPHPPIRGDKVRAWHFLEHLARRHRVHLGAFVDDASDWRHVPRLERLCASVMVRPLGTRRQLVRLPIALGAGRPLSTGLYGDGVMRRWVKDRLGGGIDVSIAVSAAAATLLLDRDDAHPAILDLRHCDSERWRLRAAAASWPFYAPLRREYRLVHATERAAAWYFDRTILDSRSEVALLEAVAPESSARFVALGNGVDTDFFDPAPSRPDPYPRDGRQTLVFSGAMEEPANMEAVLWFAGSVMPALRARGLPVRLAVVGARPPRRVRRLASRDVVVTGRVEDVRPWLRHAAVALAPFRVPAGMQLKALEAMAMALPVVATSPAVVGLDAEPGRHLLLADDAVGLADAIGHVLGEPARARQIGAAARHHVVSEHRWEGRLRELDRLIASMVREPTRERQHASH